MPYPEAVAGLPCLMTGSVATRYHRRRSSPAVNGSARSGRGGEEVGHGGRAPRGDTELRSGTGGA